jgi:coenzyme F420-0:L-glutamate ligase/coenzyme F420-1:gamma-L-glutamate ligase
MHPGFKAFRFSRIKMPPQLSTFDRDGAPLSRSAAIFSTRRSIRNFRQQDLPGGCLEFLLSSMCSAPSAHNRQPWRAVVLVVAEDKATLADAMGARLRADRARDGDTAATVEADVGRSRHRLTSAAALIVLSLDRSVLDTYPDAARNEAEYLTGVQGVAMAGQNILLAAAALGLGGCWMCGPLFCPEVVAEVLALPESWRPQGLIALGVPADMGKRKPRRPWQELTRFGAAQ